MHGLRYDLALARYQLAAEKWLEARQRGIEDQDAVDRARRTFRREERRERRARKRRT